jgi:glycosyltransferase involved in cell wall biosynthesis
MACGIPCVATRVGDAALLVGEVGYLADPGDVGAIHLGLRSLLSESPEARAQRSARCRERIVGSFSLEALARTTEQQLLGLMPDLATVSS